MDKIANTIEAFHQYAEDRLKEHMAELKTKYQNENLPSAEEKKKAFEEHFKHYKDELTVQMKELSKNNTDSAKQLNNVYKMYEVKFEKNYNNSQ